MAMILAGMADIILAGGVEHMSGVPYTLPAARWGCRLQDQILVDALIHALHSGSHILPHPEDGPLNAEEPPLSFFKGKPYLMGHTAEFIAQDMNISRREMDIVALRSHNETERATRDGSFREEIVPVLMPQKRKDPVVFDKDEHFRPGLTLEGLEKLPPAFVPEIGKVTAGNSSGINDGSAALVIMSAQKPKNCSSRDGQNQSVAGAPAILGHGTFAGAGRPASLGPQRSSNKHFELIELNEAFAARISPASGC